MKVGDKVIANKRSAWVEGTELICVDIDNECSLDLFTNGIDTLWQHRKQYDLISPQTDSIVESVINQFKQRSEVGINKYGTTLDRNDLSTLEWIEHAKQEAMDFILYLEKLKHELK
jgi:hypothetical protein